MTVTCSFTGHSRAKEGEAAGQCLMVCVRGGDSPLTYMPAIAGELVLGASDLWLSKSCRSCP